MVMKRGKGVNSAYLPLSILFNDWNVWNVWNDWNQNERWGTLAHLRWPVGSSYVMLALAPIEKLKPNRG